MCLAEDFRATAYYELDRKLDAAGFIDAKRAEFNDGQKAHQLFWNRYRRPPKKEYWHYIVERRDLLVPQDVRERKGSFFTPQIWVEKAQETLAEVLGENWQDEYDVWDCAAGTGNLLAGLQNKYRIWASTLNQADVEVMKERIKNGANLLESHVFRFDFLNGSFDDLPDGLKAIVNDPERRKKLVVFINPPYAEAASATTRTGTGANKVGVSTEISLNGKYKLLIGAAANELFALFLLRIARDIQGCTLGQFSTLKHVLAPNFAAFPKESDIQESRVATITKTNFLVTTIYLAVRHCIEADWLNNRDQFLWPEDSWKTDYEFQLDCLIYTLFHGQNRISCKVGVNHWIPFAEAEVDAKDAYKSHFMIDFLRNAMGGAASGRASGNGARQDAAPPIFDGLSTHRQDDLFAGDAPYNPSTLQPCYFSTAASRVLDAGRRLWRYYHSQPDALPDASFYDIRAHFQGFKPNGHMNPDSQDAEYTRLISDLRAAMKDLAAKIAPKVREHGFLR